MLRQDDSKAPAAEGIWTETEAGPLVALALKRGGCITMLGYEGPLRLMRLGAEWLRRRLILFILTGLASQRLPVSA